MIILFGFRRMSRRLGTAFIMCPYCATPAAQAVVRVRRWFTLFFIPVIPLGSKYVITCTMCGRATQVGREVAEHYVTPVQGEAPPTGAPLEGAGLPSMPVPSQAGEPFGGMVPPPAVPPPAVPQVGAAPDPSPATGAAEGAGPEA